MSERMSNARVIPQMWRSQGPSSALTAAQPHLVMAVLHQGVVGCRSQVPGAGDDWLTIWPWPLKQVTSSLCSSQMRHGLDSEGLPPLAAAAAVLGRGLKYATLIFARLFDLCTWFQKASIKGLSVFSCQK